MNKNKLSIIELIKNKNIKELENIIKKNKNIDLNIKDDNNNYFIFYVIMYNYESVLDIILKKNLKLDFLSIDKRSILYIPIKFLYNNVLKKLLEYDSKNIGVNLVDIKDRLGLTALHYSIIFNNFEAFKLLIDYKANILTTNNQNLNAFHLSIQYDKNDYLIYLLNLINEIDFYTDNKDNLLHFCLRNDNFDFIPLILKKKININSREDLNGLTALHMAIMKNSLSTIGILINFGANINIQDFYGNSALHYAVSEKNETVINLILKYNPNFDLINIDGNTALHIYLENNNMNKHILEILIKHTNLNIQNNSGITCLKQLLDLDLFLDYQDILETKELNFFISDNLQEDMDKYLNKPDILSSVVNSYFNNIVNKEDLTEDWEKWCSNSLIDKLKTLKINKEDPIDICKEKIRQVIKEEKRTLPKLKDLKLVLDNGIFVNYCFYTGIPLDILFGLLYLYQTFKKQNFSLILDYPLSINIKLEEHYKKNGLDYPFKLEFSNCEILWSYQKIFYPSYFEDEFNKKMNDKDINYIAIPIGIELTTGSHANILFVDKINKTIERFEPNGANNPIGLNYNPSYLDDILENKFLDYNLVFIKPNDFLPNIGFQILENLEEAKCKKLGDPNGFCGIWCTWWVFHRLKNPSIPNNELANLLIQTIKMKNLSFRNLIRNFSYYIVELRDNSLKKYNIDINDWMVGNVTLETINHLEKDILNNKI
jgi:ankyrin repeat protein